MIILFSIDDVTPVGQGRARVTTRGGYPRFYDPKKSSDWKSIVAHHAKMAMRGNNPLDKSVIVRLGFRFNAPKKLKKEERQRMETSWTPHTSKPDIDNLVKAALDGMTGICFVDDIQVWRVTAAKCYAVKAGVDVRIEG